MSQFHPSFQHKWREYPESPIYTEMRYSSMDAAAEAAFHCLIKPSDPNLEYTGGIVHCTEDGSYMHSVPTIPDGDTYNIRVPLYHNTNLVAIYHTHPPRPDMAFDGYNCWSEFFSPYDIWFADNLGVPSYIGVVKHKRIQCYVPHKDKLLEVDIDIKVNPMHRAKVSMGHHVCAWNI